MIRRKPGTRAGRLKLDVFVYPEVLLIEEAGGFMRGAYVGRAYRNGLRIGGVKLTLDASPQGRTAWLSQPYLTPPPGQPAGFAGYSALRDEQAIAAVSRAFRENWQIIMNTCTCGLSSTRRCAAPAPLLEGRSPADTFRPAASRVCQ